MRRAIIVIITIILAFTGYYYLSTRPTVLFDKTVSPAPAITGPWLQIGQTKIPVELATTSAAIQQGLSGRSSLDQDKGMLFVFETPSRYRFWMPDMHFPLDFVWIGNDYSIVDVDENVSNEFNSANPAFYRPAKPAQYVLEVNAGFIKKNNLSIGEKVKFEQIKI